MTLDTENLWKSVKEALEGDSDNALCFHTQFFPCPNAKLSWIFLSRAVMKSKKKIMLTHHAFCSEWPHMAPIEIYY